MQHFMRKVVFFIPKFSTLTMSHSPYFQCTSRVTRAATRTLASKAKHLKTQTHKQNYQNKDKLKFKIQVKIDSDPVDTEKVKGENDVDIKTSMIKEEKISKSGKRQPVKIEYEPINSSESTNELQSGRVPLIKPEPDSGTYINARQARLIKKVSDDNFQQPETKRSKWEPTLWREQLTNIYEMRKHRNAPVDSMGCDVISDATESPKVHAFLNIVTHLNIYKKRKKKYSI